MGRIAGVGVEVGEKIVVVGIGVDDNTADDVYIRNVRVEVTEGAN